MTYVITDLCVDVKDLTCITECPVDCIYEGERMMYINPDECIDCGACEMVCPMNAIVSDFDVDGPEQQRALERNREDLVRLDPALSRSEADTSIDHALWCRRRVSVAIAGDDDC